MDLSLDSFALQRLAFEVRYKPAYLLWDRAGAIAKGIVSLFPNASVTTAEPGKIHLIVGRDYEIVFQLDRVSIVGHHIRVSEFINSCTRIVPLVIELLEIDEFNRIGFLQLYAKNFDSIETLSQASNRFVGFSIPAEGLYGIENGKPSLPSYGLRWEGDATGARIKIRAQTTKLEFNPPIAVRDFEPESKETYTLMYEVDFYTLKDVSVGQFKEREWMDRVVRVVKRDGKYFLGG